MSAPKADEKVCPFCAETIKAAAVKCRYCGSEVPVEVPPAPAPVPTKGPAVQLRKSEPQGVPAPAAGPARVPAPTVSADDEPRRSVFGWPLLVILLLAGLLAVFLAVRSVNADETAPDGSVTSSSARAVAMQRAADSTAAILSYAADTFDADAKKAGTLMTAGMRADYLKALEPVKDKVVKEGIVLKATVVATSLTHYEGDTVRALVFVNQSTTAKGAKNEQLDNNRIVVTMKREKGDWLISKMDPF